MMRTVTPIKFGEVDLGSLEKDRPLLDKTAILRKAHRRTLLVVEDER